MMIESISILLIGLALLLIGSNLLVASTDNTSKRFSISGFYASFFMIGIATSAPEIFISIESALQDKTILAIGNALGSNISNIALVFCISLFFIKGDLIKENLPIRPYVSMIILTISAFVLMFFDERLDVKDSLVLIVLLIVCVYFFQPTEDKKLADNKGIPSLSNIIFYLLILDLCL